MGPGSMIEKIAYLGLCDEDAIELDLAALDIAALDQPQARTEGYVERLAEMAAELRRRAGEAPRPQQQVEALVETLAGRFGFEGDQEDYDNPNNADLMSVMDRRRGLPISLAILYVAQARRRGWTAQALNTPGHVLVAVGEGTPFIIDPFRRGAFVGPERLAALLETALGPGAAIGPEHLAPLPNRSVLVRLMMNQAVRAEAAGQPARALAIFQRISTVAPGYSQGWWDRARLELRLGDPPAARACLSAMLETTRDPALRAHINQALDTLASGPRP